MRPLTFMDDTGRTQRWEPAEPDPDASPFDRPGWDAFEAFTADHPTPADAAFGVRDEAADEEIWLRYDDQVVTRATGDRVEFKLATNRGDYKTTFMNFERAGFEGLNMWRPYWRTDVAPLERERIRTAFENSMLRRTHPRELVQRLDVLTRIDGGSPAGTSRATRYGFATDAGGEVDAWFGPDGRGLVVVRDHTGPLATSDDGASADLYEGVPSDVLDLVRAAPVPDGVPTVAGPGGTALPAATGVFVFAAPCSMTEALVERLQTAGLTMADTGVDRVLGPFLAPREFTPEAVAEAAPWWSAEQIARGFAEAGPAPEATAAGDQADVERFCEIWGDSGFNDPWGVHHVFFDGESMADVDDEHAELLALIERLGLVRVDAPAGRPDGEVWVRTDARIDDELEHYA